MLAGYHCCLLADFSLLHFVLIGGVRKQFGFDQEVPTMMGIAVGEILIVNPFLKTRAFAYWSGVAPRVVIPSSNY